MKDLSTCLSLMRRAHVTLRLRHSSENYQRNDYCHRHDEFYVADFLLPISYRAGFFLASESTLAHGIGAGIQ